MDTDGASEYVYVCSFLGVPDMCAWSVCCHKISIHQQHSSSSTSSTTSPVFQATKYCICTSSHGVCVCGRCTAGNRTTTATLSHAQCNNPTHIVRPHTRNTKHKAVARPVAHTHHRNAYVLSCHHCIYFTWYDTCLLYTSPITHNKESQIHLRQHTALVVCETELRPHTNATAAAPPPSKPPLAHHISTTAAAHQQHSSRDSRRGGGDLTSPAAVYMPDFTNRGKRQDKTYQFKLKPLSKNQKP